jgi:hypothetical protein
MKTLNPIIHQILQERFQATAIKPPPRFTGPKMEMPPVKPSVRLEPPGFVKVEPVPSGPPRVSVNFDVYPQTPKSTIIDIITATEKRNPALVKQTDYQKLNDFLKFEVDSAIQRTGSNNYDDIWMEVTKANPTIIDRASITVQDTLDDVISNSLKTEVPPPTPLKVGTLTPSEMPATPEPQGKVEPELQAEPETELSKIIATTVMPALVPMAAAALQPSPQRSKTRDNKRIATGTDELPVRGDGDEDPTYTEMARRKEYEEAITKPFSFEDEYPGLELEKTLGKYGGSFVKR